MSLVSQPVNQPTVAVVTPAYNDARWLRECVTSVRKAAALARLPIAHIVCDDASTDDTAKLLPQLQQTHGVLSLRLPKNSGCSAALNAAIRLTSAEWLLVLASDDLVRPRAFRDWLGAIREHPHANVVYSDLELIGARRGLYQPPAYSPALLQERSIIPGASFLNRQLWVAVGGFDEGMPSAQDWDLWVRAHLVIGLQPIRLPVPLVQYRYHNVPRLHDRSVQDIERIRQVIRSRTKDNAVLTVAVAA